MKAARRYPDNLGIPPFPYTDAVISQDKGTSLPSTPGEGIPVIRQMKNTSIEERAWKIIPDLPSNILLRLIKSSPPRNRNG